MFKHLAQGRRLLARFEMSRRLGTPILRRVRKRRGLAHALRFVRDVHGRRKEDPALAWRYRKLGLLPEGTLGRAYWKYSREHEFAMPGEVGGPDEIVVNHDFVHVLTGYGTDPAGEFEAAAFTAGVAGEDPFAFVAFVMLQFHLGVSLSPVGTTERGFFPPGRTLRALERGARCRVDFTDGWDHWPVIERPIAELRAEYGIKKVAHGGC
jgi:ubiquinone biosynthesis protein Coq4